MADIPNQLERPKSTLCNQLHNTDGVSVTMSEALRQYIDGLGLAATTPAATPEERRRQLEMARDAGTASKILLGYWLAQIRQEEGQAAFVDAYTVARIGRRSAYNAVAALNLFNRLPDLKAVAALGQLEPTKVLELKHWDDEELVEFAQGHEVRELTLNVAIDMSVEKIKKEQREWLQQHDLALQAEKKRSLHLEAELEVSQRKADRLEAELAGRKAHDPLPDWYRYARHDALLYTEALALNLAELERTLNEHIAAAPRSTADEDTLACMAADTVVHTLAGVLASGQALLARASEYSSQGEADAALLTTLRIDDDELTTLSRNRAQLIREMETDKAVRRFQREQEGKRPVGRPRKGPGAK